MIIKNLQVNSFGNLSEKNIELKNGLNVITGANETGKSTLVAFTKAMLYGVCKTKNGDEYSESEKYKPWNSDDSFSGKMEYIHDDNSYTIVRNFSNNSAKIYNKDNEDISALFNKSKSRGLEVGFEQLKIDEDTFESSALVKQKNIEVSRDNQSSVIQRLTNIIQSGNENMSYEDAKKKIEKKLYDEVGTDRTATKPKYICRKEIAELEVKKDNLILNRERQDNIEKRKKQLLLNQEKIRIEKEEVEKFLNIKLKYDEEVQKEKIKFDAEKKAKDELNMKREKDIKTKKIIDTVIIVLAVIALFVAFFVIHKYVLCGAVIVMGIIMIFVNFKFSYKEIIEAESSNFDLVTEDIRKKENKELKALIEGGYKADYKEEKIQELKKKLNGAIDALKDFELETHKLNLEEEAIRGNVDDLNEIIEELNYKKQELAQINEKEAIYNLALEKLNEAYYEIKSRVTPEIQKNIKYSISKTTNGKYTDVQYSDSRGIVFLDNIGNLEPINKLSIGTMDQMYLGFRLAIADGYANVPLIFDEAFVFFDDERLKSMLKMLLEISSERQVIILSCSSREKDILDSLGAEYNLIKM